MKMQNIDIKTIYKIVNDISLDATEVQSLPINWKLRLLPLIKSDDINKFELAKINISIHKKLDVITSLVEQIEKKNIKIILLKGTSLVTNYTKIDSSRNFGDIDILVEKSKLDALETILEDNFTKAGSDNKPFSNTYEKTWNHQKFKNIQLDIHTSIYHETIYKQDPIWFEYSELHKYFNSKSIHILQPELQIAHLIVHSIKDERMYDYEIIDICNILKKRKLNSEIFKRITTELGIVEIANHLLNICQNILNKNLEGITLKKIPKNRIVKKLYFYNAITTHKKNLVIHLAVYIHRLIFRKR